MENRQFYVISGNQDGRRIDSRILEENIQSAVSEGNYYLDIKAFGQHGIGGRLWKTGAKQVFLKVEGPVGQRLGAMGYPNTFIEVMGPASDDVGWLNTGARIVVHGNASNGVANAMAQGKIYIGGNIGARGMTMTKENPRFEPPELWVLGSVGDYFGEFMAGGIAVICGHDPQTPENILGYRPLVGMVGGSVFFRGPHHGYFDADAKPAPIDDERWKWLCDNLKLYLDSIGKIELFKQLSGREDWQLLEARSPQERISRQSRAMGDFKTSVWDSELGPGGLVGDLTDLDRSTIPVITRGDLRRYVPVWENKKYKAPCEASCPSGIPVQERWRLVREGRVDEAVDLALAYTPFPATVCGYLCPNLCMESCTKKVSFMEPVDITRLGKESIKAGMPDLPELNGNRVAVIGGGPGGISVAWQLRQQGVEAVIYDTAPTLGGKIASVIPDSRIPKEVLEAELGRITKVLPHVHLQQTLVRKEVERMGNDYEFVIFAPGAQNPRTLPISGNEHSKTAMDFLAAAKRDNAEVGKKVVIIGAGNVGCDVATEAARLGADDITLLDVQEPASFGKEREDAEEVGARFRWPVFTKEITKNGVLLDSGELVPADEVVISIGDNPDLDFLPEDVLVEKGFIVVDENYQTSNPGFFAIGDAVRPGLLTDAIGMGRKAAETIVDILAGRKPSTENRLVIDKKRVSLEYYDPRITEYKDLDHCGNQCSSCGTCRDCGICVAMCPETAISRIDSVNNGYEYVVDRERCIGCGFCAGACPCGIWNLVPNEPIG